MAKDNSLYNPEKLDDEFKKHFKHIIEFAHIPKDQIQRAIYFQRRKTQTDLGNELTRRDLFQYLQVLVKDRQALTTQTFELFIGDSDKDWDTFKRADSLENKKIAGQIYAVPRTCSAEKISIILCKVAEYLENEDGLKNLITNFLEYCQVREKIIPALSNHENIEYHKKRDSAEQKEAKSSDAVSRNPLNIVQFFSYKGIKSCFLLLTNQSNVKSLDRQIEADFDLVVEVDTGSSELIINRNMALLTVSESIVEQLREPARSFHNYESAIESIRLSQRTVEALKDTQFHTGFTTIFEDILQRINSTNTERLISVPKHKNFKQVYARLWSNKFDFESYFRSGLIVFQSVLSDLSVIAKTEGMTVCIHLANNSLFPETIVETIVSDEIGISSKDKMRLLVSGYPTLEEKSTWPKQRYEWLGSMEAKVRMQNADKCDLTEFWSFHACDSIHLQGIQSVIGARKGHALLCHVLLTGHLNVQHAIEILNLPLECMEDIGNYLRSYFRGLDQPPSSWRKVLLQRV